MELYFCIITTHTIYTYLNLRNYKDNGGHYEHYEHWPGRAHSADQISTQLFPECLSQLSRLVIA